MNSREEQEIWDRFDRAADYIYGKIPTPLDMETGLRLYALFKQATEGNAPAAQVDEGDAHAKAKRSAWEKMRGIARVDAMLQYIEAANAVGFKSEEN